MEEKMRKTGIDLIGDAPWGTHFCLFYQTKEDLIDILVPYFKKGLENNELCVWVTSEPLGEKDVRKAIKKAVPDFDAYLGRGQMEIISPGKWYPKSDTFNLQRVINAWIDKHNQALLKGFDGLRVAGNTSCLEKGDWRNSYCGEAINKTIGQYQMMALCTYPVDKCKVSEIIDVVGNHRAALIRHDGAWEIIESPERKQIREVLQEKTDNIAERIKELNCLCGISNLVEKPGTSLEEILQRTVDLIPPAWQYPEITAAQINLEHQTFKTKNYKETIWKQSAAIIGKNDRIGTLSICYLEERPKSEEGPFLKEERNLINAIAERLGNIIERKRERETLEVSERRYRLLTESMSDVIWTADLKLNLTDISPSVNRLLGYHPEEMIADRAEKILGLRHIRTIMKLVEEKKRRELETAMEYSDSQTVEFELRRKDGSTVWVETGITFLRDAYGRPREIIGVMRDSTARRKAEERIEEYTNKLKEGNEQLREETRKTKDAEAKTRQYA